MKAKVRGASERAANIAHRSPRGRAVSGNRRSGLELEMAEEARTREALLFMLEDLTEQHQALEQARLNWLSTVDALGDPLMVHDREFRIVRANRAYAERAGLEFKELIGRPYWECFPKRSGPLASCQHAASRAGAEARKQALVEEFVLDSGEIFVSRAFGVPGQEGGLLYGLHVFEDITERTRLREALQRSERHYRKLIEDGSDVFVLIDAAAKVIYQSESGKRLTGWGSEDVVGREGIAYVLPEYEAAARNALAEALGNPQKTTRVELQVQCKDGSQLDVEAQGRNLLDDPDVRGIVMTVRDITERKARERALARTNRALRTLSAGNEALVRAKDETGLLQDMVRILTQIGGYPIAFVGYAKDDAAKSVEPKACAGIEPSALAQPAISWSDDERGQSAVGRAIRLGATQIIRNADQHAGYEPWRTALRSSNVTATLGLPLRLAAGEPAMGAIGIATTDGDAFDADELKLLEELAEDLAYGIQTLRLRDEQRKAEEKLRVLARFPEENPHIVIRVGASGVVLYANPAGADFLRSCGGRVGEPVPAAYAALIRRAFDVAAVNREEATEGGRIYALTFAPIEEAGYVNVYGVDITERKHAEQALRGAMVATIGAMAATVEARDPYTAGHQRRVADLAAAIAREMGMPEAAVEGIHFGALIHDLGKVQVPAELLSKPSRLTKIEFELIKSHPQAGYEIVKGIEFPWPVAKMVLQHHERVDGTGYPNGAKGEEIVLEARILAVADVVEAMFSHRPYRPGLGIDAALKAIEDQRGRAFEPQAVDACLRLFREQGHSIPA